jgi:uncharacterized protein (DUF2141 family)
MTRLFKSIFALGFAIIAVVPAYAGDVTITIDAVDASGGDLYISLQRQEEFLQPRGSYGTIIKAPKAGPQTVVLKDIAPGDYAVSVWHDIDADGKFSMGSDGRPSDGWSMNNAAALRGMPTWDVVKFSVPAAGKVLPLNMIYAK